MTIFQLCWLMRRQLSVIHLVRCSWFAVWCSPITMQEMLHSFQRCFPSWTPEQQLTVLHLLEESWWTLWSFKENKVSDCPCRSAVSHLLQLLRSHESEPNALHQSWEMRQSPVFIILHPVHHGSEHSQLSGERERVWMSCCSFMLMQPEACFSLTAIHCIRK